MKSDRPCSTPSDAMNNLQKITIPTHTLFLFTLASRWRILFVKEKTIEYMYVIGCDILMGGQNLKRPL